MVVEDEALSALNLKSDLLGLGYEVPAVVASGEEAVRRAGEIIPDLILMDIHLEGELSGIEAAAEIARAHPIPIIYLTAHADSDTLGRAKRTEPFGYITKPYALHSLAATIEVALYKSEAELERERLMAALQASLAQVKLLSGLLPICAACKKIRGDEGYWQQIEEFISDHSEAEFSHGICPECAQELYPEIFPGKSSGTGGG